MIFCEIWSDDVCTEVATVERNVSGGWMPTAKLCQACADAYDNWLANFDPPDMDGEDVCRDYPAERRDAMDEARRLK